MGPLCCTCRQKTWLDTAPDPHTGLSDQDRELIRKSWAQVMQPQHLKANGMKLFLQLFREYPYTKEYFGFCKNVTNEEHLKRNPMLNAHASRVMHAIECYVSLLDNPEGLMWVLADMTNRHKTRNVKTQQFKEFCSVLLPFLNTVLGPAADAEVIRAWGVFIRLLLTVVENNNKAPMLRALLVKTDESEIKSPMNLTRITSKSDQDLSSHTKERDFQHAPVETTIQTVESVFSHFRTFVSSHLEHFQPSSHPQATSETSSSDKK